MIHTNPMIERLAKSAEERRSILCFGVDPDMSKINAVDSAISTEHTVEESLGPFFHDIIARLLEENQISALKPNYAFFAQYGFDGLYVLRDLIQHYRGRVPIILDAKRGDIGKTGVAYAREVYDFWGADAVTVSPYMGNDSVAPFLRAGKLVYVLCKTSNPGSADFQDLKCGKTKLYETVAKRVMDWDAKSSAGLGSCGLVVGATSDSIKKITKITDNKTPLLIPGIGTQGGDLGLVMGAIKKNPWIHRINASSSIAYAFEKQAGVKPADAALKEAQKLNNEMRKYL